MTYFFDASAIIKIIEFNDAENISLQEGIITNALHLSEIYFYFLKKHNKQTADYWMNNLNIEIIEITKDVAIESSRFKFENIKKNLSYADCIGYITSLKNGLTFLTADTAFSDFHGVEIV